MAEDSVDESEYVFLGHLSLPPAGLQGRSATDVVEAAWIWGDLELMATASGICPRCSAAVNRSVSVCEDHETTDGFCEQCDRRYAAHLHIN